MGIMKGGVHFPKGKGLFSEAIVADWRGLAMKAVVQWDLGYDVVQPRVKYRRWSCVGWC